MKQKATERIVLQVTPAQKAFFEALPDGKVTRIILAAVADKYPRFPFERREVGERDNPERNRPQLYIYDDGTRVSVCQGDFEKLIEREHENKRHEEIEAIAAELLQFVSGRDVEPDAMAMDWIPEHFGKEFGTI
jgi:hypothetical protein